MNIPYNQLTTSEKKYIRWFLKPIYWVFGVPVIQDGLGDLPVELVKQQSKTH